MIISKNQKLNQGHPIDLRIKKSEEIYQCVLSLKNLFSQYAAQTKLMNTLEGKIANELNFFYHGQNYFTEFINRFTIALKYRTEFVQKELAIFEKELGNIRQYEKAFESLTPFAKTYLKNSQLLVHYEQKIPKLMDQSEAKRRQEGKLNEAMAKRLMRNQKKLEDARVNTLVSSTNIVELSNKLNIERFGKINPVISSFIAFQINVANFSSEKLAVGIDRDAVLSRAESPDFNLRFFVEMDPAQIERLSRPSLVLGSVLEGQKPAVQYKQNVQNNYYVLNERSKSQTPFGSDLGQPTQRPGDSYGYGYGNYPQVQGRPSEGPLQLQYPGSLQKAQTQGGSDNKQIAIPFLK